ncbi:unnamed protein product [Peniophora sp. CBMAI 1063]|nr:unnamed protein product [Peniophora sp. CBMAI 1063]
MSTPVVDATPNPSRPATFVGRNGQVLPVGTDQFQFYGYRNGRDGSGIVTTHKAMLENIRKFPNARGRGFDEEADAVEWVDTFIKEEHPKLLQANCARLALVEGQLADARRRANI